MIDFFMPEMMALEMLVADFLFCIHLDRKDHFYLRFFGSSVLCLVCTCWIEIAFVLITDQEFTYQAANSFSYSVFKFFFYLVIYLMSILCVLFSYDDDKWTLLSYCSGAYMSQHLASNVVSLLFSLEFFRSSNLKALFFYLLTLFVFSLVYFLVYWLFIRGHGQIKGSRKTIKFKAIISFIVIFIGIFLSRLTTDNPQRNDLSLLAESIYAIISSILILIILFSLEENDKIQNELDITTELLHREKEQYKLSKENIELINMKCHDLKHQIMALKEDGSAKHIQEVENAVKIYDSAVKTGNDVLDVILTEKSLVCEKNKITLTCMVNGEDLSFMDNMDIYSLFGNALSNAIESTSKIEDEDKRCISINVKTVGNMLSSHIENFYQGNLSFSKDGLPLTDKDKNYHGFGVLSMDRIVKSYDGVMNINAKNGLFCLDFVIPIKKTKKVR
jgi:hypothetical protein